MLPPRDSALPGQRARIAYPAISTGVYRFPADRTARIAVTATIETLGGAAEPSRVIFCCFSDESARLHAEALAQATPLV